MILMNQRAADLSLPCHIFLIGFMGSGKTTIGKELARLLDREQVDMDQLIETETGLTVSEIFQRYGEEYFRDLESNLIQRLAADTDLKVICTGGGVVLRDENIYWMKKSGALVLLNAHPEEIYRRIADDSSRPLLKNRMDVEKISEMMLSRMPFYEKAADIFVETDNRAAAEICDLIVDRLSAFSRKTPLKLKNVRLGEGPPKICIPLTGSTSDRLMAECNLLENLPCDLIEWRVDFFEEVDHVTTVLETLQGIRNRFPDTPLIFTFRSVAEGGVRSMTPSSYRTLYRAVMDSGMVDAVDVELFLDESLVKDMVEEARKLQVAVIISNHDFEKTPTTEEMVNRLLKAAELGGHLPKLAVMPRSAADVLALEEATRRVVEIHQAGPVITMAMGGLGFVTRLTGEIFGSAVTFGTAGAPSAPGQIPADELHRMIQIIHRQLKGS